MAKIEPWERQEGESAKAFEAFCIYRDLGINRSIAKVVQELGKSKALLERWSANHDWVERAAQWDAEQDRVVRQQQLDDIKKMRKRHADLAEAMLIKAARALKRIPDDEIKAGDLTKMLVLQEEIKTYPLGAVWDYFCLINNVPVSEGWYNEVVKYEKEVLLKR